MQPGLVFSEGKAVPEAADQHSEHAVEFLLHAHAQIIALKQHVLYAPEKRCVDAPAGRIIKKNGAAACLYLFSFMWR
jgi:hypothetical protein